MRALGTASVGPGGGGNPWLHDGNGQDLASDLLSTIGTACEKCDNCQMDKPCKLMSEPILPKVSIPNCVLERLDWLQTAWECQVCLADLEEKLMEEEVVYGGDTTESEGISSVSEDSKRQ